MGNSQPEPDEDQSLFLKNGIFKGEVLGKSPHGIGYYTFDNGDRYKGRFNHGKLQKGRCLYSNQDFYLGCWYFFI